MRKWVFLGACLISFQLTNAQVVGFNPREESDSASATTMPQVHLVTVKDRLLTRVPGSVAVINASQINKISPLSGNDVLKKIPGLNVVDEEGAGLRVNIGIRGLDPDRSRNILMLEDGIPVALNPYGEPEMYFTPVIDKVKAIEVLKGSGQILFGPQTIGGVVNFITATPPTKETTMIKLRAGEGGFFSGYTSYGNTIGNTGFLISYLHKRADNLGPTEFVLNDLSAKLHFRLSDRSSVGVKLGVYDEVSNSSYIGLTQTMYDKGDQDFVRMAPDDLLPVRRYNASITHQYKINSKVQLLSNVFAYTTTRNWRRQEFSTSKTAANKTGVIWGDTSVAGGAIYMLNANGHRNRQFEVLGFEPQLKIETSTGSLKHELHLGSRLIVEKADEQFIIGKKPSATAGDLRDDEVRSGLALSAYVQDKIKLSSKLSLNAGIRIENLDYKRQITRGRFTVNGNTVTADTNVIAKGNVFAVIPGIGFNYEANDRVNIFGGIHKGFAPPRTKDAITSTGIPLNIEEEKSWNTELGLRTQLQQYISAEVTGFYMQFSNQIIPVSQSSGQSNATGLANGGATKHLGIEAAIEVDIAKSLGAPYSITLGGNVTYVHSKFSADRFINKSGSLTNIKGNKLPYAPSLIINSTLGFEAAKGYGIRFFGNFTDKQFTDELNTTTPIATGLTGIIDSRFIMDATAYYPLKKDKINFSISAKNLTNERYIVSRRPQGIKVGIDRQVTAGVNVRL